MDSRSIDVGIRTSSRARALRSRSRRIRRLFIRAQYFRAEQRGCAAVRDAADAAWRCVLDYSNIVGSDAGVRVALACGSSSDARGREPEPQAFAGGRQHLGNTPTGVPTTVQQRGPASGHPTLALGRQDEPRGGSDMAYVARRQTIGWPPVAAIRCAKSLASRQKVGEKPTHR